MNEAAPGRGASTRRGPIIPFVVLGVSLILTAAAAYYVAATSAAKDTARFETAIERTNDAISRRIETYVNLLRGGAGLFATEPYITRKQFKYFADRLALDEHYPGILGIGAAARLTPAVKDEVVKRMRSEGMPTFAISPDKPDRDEYCPVIYLEPMTHRNAAVIGYDMYTEPTRRAAMDLARDNGHAVTTAKVTLVQEIDASRQPGFLIYMPVYYFGGVPQTVELRRQILGGFVYAPFRADDLFAGILGDSAHHAGIAFSLYDGDTISDATLLHRSDAHDPAPAKTRFNKTVQLQVPGRLWTLVYRSRPEFESTSSRGLTAFVAGAGGLASFVLFLLSFAQASARRNAESAAAELRQSEQALRSSESRFRRLVESNLVGVAFSTIDGRVLDGNDEYFRIIGRRRDEARAGNVRWDTITGSRFLEVDKAAVEQLRTTGICIPFEKEYQRPDGSHVPVLVGVAMLEGSATETVAMVLDLTAQKQAERQIVLAKENAEAARAEAEAASRLKDEFLATVSHELRTPLNAIFGWSQLLSAGRTDPQELQHGLNTIQRSAKAQAQLIDDLLDVSRIVAGKLRLDVHLVQLAPVIEAALAPVRPAAEAKGVTIAANLDSSVGAVNGDPQRIQQVIWNLLSNAVKFTPRGGSIDIELTEQNGHAKIIVRDTGIGIDPAFLPHIFERFRQADASTTRKYGGLGLGLAIVRHLVELHGGTVEAHSEGEGKGATFSVSLLLAVAAPVMRTHPHSPSDSQDHGELENVRVLFVDDDQDARELISRMLRQRGAQVTLASSAAEGFAAFEHDQPHVLVSDIGMPDEDGYALLSRIRSLPAERGGKTPAVALTALARPEDRRRALGAGFQMHLAKPIDATELTTVISQLTAN